MDLEVDAWTKNKYVVESIPSSGAQAINPKFLARHLSTG